MGLKRVGKRVTTRYLLKPRAETTGMTVAGVALTANFPVATATPLSRTRLDAARDKVDLQRLRPGLRQPSIA